MLEAEHKFRIKWGRGIRHCWSPLHSASNTLLCSQETLDHMTWSNPDSRMLEHLVWSIYDGILTLGSTPKLVGPESYNQVLRCLTTKAFRGLQVCCSARASAQFDELPLRRVWSVVLMPPKCKGAKKVEFKDTASLKEEDIEKGAVGGERYVDPDKYTLAWMCDHQHGYTDEQIEFWPLLHPLTDGSEVKTWQLAHWLFSMWHWSSATHPMSCPPAPTNMEIRQWLPLNQDQEGEKQDLWTEAYVCSLQHIVEAATGRSWTSEGEGMVPFLAATGRHVCPHSIRKCWLPKHSIIPKEPIDEIRVIVMQKLDMITMWKLSYTAWDIFAYPDSNKSNWKEDCLSYSPGVTIDLGTRMLGIWLALHDTAGKYQGIARVLKFEGHMLAYDPNKWCRVDPNEGSFLFTYGSRVTICQKSGKLLPLPLYGTSGPRAPATSSCRASHKIHAGWGRVIILHLDRLRTICCMGH